MEVKKVSCHVFWNALTPIFLTLPGIFTDDILFLANAFLPNSVTLVGIFIDFKLLLLNPDKYFKVFGNVTWANLLSLKAISSILVTPSGIVTLTKLL